jgi:phospholipid/cholesterol/gamma-HCH transport system substrate-binding protein
MIGFLVILGLSLMVVFGYWLLKPADNLEMKKYIIYFDESVLGLNMDAPVKYRGISVGKVTRLGINPNNSEQIEILVTILKTTPIKASTVAQLTSQGITGLSYINLDLGDNNSPALEAKEGDEFAVIKTTPSLLIKLEKTFGDVSSDLSSTLARTKELLNENNQDELTQLFKSSASFMNKINQLLDDKTINNLKQTVHNLNITTKKLDEMMSQIEKFLNNSVEWEDKISNSFKSITGSYMGIKETMDYFRAALIRGDFNIKKISNEVIPTMNSTMLEMQTLMIKIQEAIDQHERSPSDMIFKQEKIKKGPGEK